MNREPRFLGLLCAVAAAGPGCSEPDTARLGRVHDLISLVREVEFSANSVYRYRRVAGVDDDDNRDGVTYVHMLAGSSGTWPPLETRGVATLAFGCGVVSTDGEAGDRPARFRIEGRIDGRDEEAAWRVLFDEVLRPADLTDAERVKRFAVTLPGTEPARWVLRLSTAAADGGGALSWPGWFSPRLESEGRAVAVEDHPVLTDRVVVDLLAGLSEATVVTESESVPVARAVLDAALDTPLAGGRRTCIRAAAPARVRYRFVPPSDCGLRFAVGMDTETGWKNPGDGMVFAVEIGGERVWEKELDPVGDPLQRGWKPVTIDLARWAGREIELDLVTEERGDAQNDVGGFANAVVSQRQRIERLAGREAPTVLLVLVDTLRADRLGVYGNEDGLSPRLDAMARDGVAFLSPRAVTSWTWPTVASVFTGLYPGAHGVHRGEGYFLVDDHETVAELFQERGYTTGAFISNVLIGEDANFHQGFETFVHTPSANARAVNERVLAWLDGNEGLARFAYVHYFDPHSPYLPPPAYLPEVPDDEGVPSEEEIVEEIRRRYAAGEIDRELMLQWMDRRWPWYDAEVRYLDEAIGDLLDALRQRGILENCIIAFTADHGEEFYEHGLIDHGGHVYDETIQVPLWITGYGKAALEPRAVAGPTEIRNLLPTLCELVDLRLPAAAGLGGDLLADPPPQSVFGQTCHGLEKGVEGWTDKYYVIEDGWKLIHTPASERFELYHLTTDPLELSDRIDDEAQVADVLRGRLDAWKERTAAERERARVEMDGEAIRMMESLGYVNRIKREGK